MQWILMRIAMISYEYPPYLVGGLGTHCQELARALVQRGNEVFVLSYCMDEGWTHEDHGVTVRHLRFPLPNRKSVYDGSVSEIADLADHLGSLARSTGLGFTPDIIHVHEWIAFMGAKRLTQMLRLPVVLTMHGIWAELIDRLGGHGEKSEVETMEKTSCLEANRVIAVSDAVKRAIVDRFQIAESHIETVPNGFDYTIFTKPAPLSKDLRWRLLKNEGHRLIVFAGRIAPQKGVAGLLRSAPAVLREHPDACYVIAGECEPGPYWDLLKKIESEHALSSRLHFVGKLSRSELADLYGCATLAVVPSAYEPFGYAAAEAMAAGVPVIASEAGGLPEIVEHEKTGLLVPFDPHVPIAYSPGYVGRLASAQCKILGDRNFAEGLGREGQDRSLRLFGIGPMAEKTISIYNGLLAH